MSNIYVEVKDVYAYVCVHIYMLNHLIKKYEK